MRPTTDIKNNGKTRTAFSCLKSRHFKTSTDAQTVFSFFLPTAHFGFDKPVLAIPNLAHLFLQKGRQKTNKLNSQRTQIGVLRTLFVRVLDAPKCTPQAYGIFILLAGKACLTLFYKNKLGFP